MTLQQKVPLSRTIPVLTGRAAVEEIAALGLALPGHVTAVSGAIVTVAFDVSGVTLPEVEMPVLESAYVRLPIQVGDLGVAVPAAVYLGGVSGLGGGVADSVRRGNLSTLAWAPIGNKNWSSVNADYVVVQGPNGVQLQDQSGAAVVTVDKTNGISMSFGGHSLVINSTGVIIDGKVFLTHAHTLVQSGTSDSGPVA